MPELDLEEWLKPDMITDNDILTFEDAGSNKELPTVTGDPPKRVFEIKVKLPEGDSKLWTMNKTSQRAVAQTYGKNTDTWVGKQVIVFKATQNVNGVMKEVIYARVPAKEETVQ